MRWRAQIVLGALLAWMAPARAQTIIPRTDYSSGTVVSVPGSSATTNTITNGPNTVTVESGATVTYTAASQITLGPGFHAVRGSIFVANIGGGGAISAPNLPITPFSGSATGGPFPTFGPNTQTFQYDNDNRVISVTGANEKFSPDNEGNTQPKTGP